MLKADINAKGAKPNITLVVPSIFLFFLNTLFLPIPRIKIFFHIPILTREPREVCGDAGWKVTNACEMGAGGGFGVNREFRSD